MGQTLTNGIYLPAEGEVRCYDGLASNWTTLDSVVGGYRAHVANENIHITSEERSKWNNGVTQAYVLRYASVSLTALGTVAFSALDNTDNIKIGDKVLDSEGKLFALTAVDTANSSATLSALLIDLSKDSDLSNYYTKTETDTLLSDKANDADAVHKSGAETIGGLKTFTDLMSIDGDYLGTEASTNQRTNLQLRSNRDTEGKSGALITRFRQNRTQGGMQTADYQMLGFDFLENEVRTNNILSVQATGWANSVPTKVYIVSSVGDYSYGNSARPCKINDNNPGALSLPDISAGVDISGYITAGNTHNEYTPTVDGWISVILKKTTTSGALAIFLYQGDVSNSYFGNTPLPNDTEYCGMASIPVKAGSVVNIDLKGSNTYVYSAKFYPCQGNV